MLDIFNVVLGGLIIFQGIILITRKKLMISRIYDSIFMPMMIMGQFLFDSSGTSDREFIMLSIIVIGSFSAMINRGRYFINNVKKEQIHSILTDILKEKNISYEEKKRTFVLKEYDRKISYKKSLDSVGVSFTDVTDLPFYKKMRYDLRNRVKKFDTSLFPKNGVLFILLGVVYIVTMLNMNL